ncbi:zinc carboxypeptidase-like [Galleria mellonella]|uniref:Zinc carboxypeptidase-like n=1 Tax=Galleria mellonella TaxID=7137 RepID=A0ABM3MYY9_GALME|nr:zinc carboxypeptidase-like [Galleria mellonella]
MLLNIIILNIILLTGAQRVNYNKYAMYEVLPQNERDMAYIRELYEKPDGVKFWSEPSIVGSYVSVIVPPDMRKNFEESLSEKNVTVKVASDNIQEMINAEEPKRRKQRTEKKREINEVYFDACLSINNIYNYFNELTQNNSDIANVFTIGKSFEGKNITGIRISRGSPSRVFVLASGEIGADCLSPTVLTYIVRELFRGDDPEALAATQDFEWHIIPIINPDGFHYSQNFDRLWVKNRRRDSLVPDGVDLTKNWNAHWGTHGGSFINSHDNYIGPGPFSEIETRLVSGYIANLAHNTRITGLLSFRTFGQNLLIPFAHTTEHLNNYQQMITIGRRSLGSLSVRYNTQYLAGTPMEFNNAFTGTIGDWVKENFDPPIVATYTLRNTHTLPANLVKPACEETYDSVIAILREARFINVI